MASLHDKLQALYPDNWEYIARHYKEKQNFTCEKCGKRYPAHSRWLHVHHITPLSKGGSSDDENLQCLCYKCHKSMHSHMNYNGGKKVSYSKPFD